MNKEKKDEYQIPDKLFFKILFLAPSITLMIFSLLLLLPDETDPDPFIVSVMYTIALDILCVGIWFIISLIIYKVIIKRISDKEINQKLKNNIQESKPKNNKVIKNDINNQNKKNKSIICSCKGNLTAKKQKEMAPLLPFVYRNYVKRGTLLTIIFTAVFAIAYHNFKGSILFFIIMELFMIILYKKQLGNLCKKAFLKSLRKNPDIDTSFVINFYKDYIEILGEHGSTKIDNNKIINKAQINSNIYLQTSDNKVIPINKEECSKETLNYIEKMFSITQNNKNTLYRKLLIILSIALILFLIIEYIIIFPSFDNYYDINKYVNTNYNELEELANDYINNNKTKLPKKVYLIDVHGPDEIYVKNDNTIVEFHMRGKGLVSSSHYYGFYYSKNNVPSCFQNGECNLVKYEKNKWKWKGDGDNRGKTIKIKDYWFYFEAHF